MKICPTMKRLALLSGVTFMLVATLSPVDAEDRLVEGAMILAPVEGRSRMGNIFDDQVCHEEEATRELEPLGVKGD